MTDWKLPWEGGCRCGQVRFKVTEAPLVTMACHCTGCQKMTSSAFSLSVLIPAGGFEITAGEPVIGGMHAVPEHYHCPWCMSWMFTRFEAGQPLVNLRATMLDDATWYAPFVETMTSEKLSWAETGAPHSFAGFPENADFPPIMAEFAQRGARP